MDQEAVDDDVDQLKLPDVTRHVQTRPLPIPVQNPALLPLSALDPEVLERIAAEIVSRHNNLSTQFYGRRGQKQYGLDIVERERTLSRSLYQVKRYQALSEAKLRAAVTDFAGAVRPPGYQGAPRRFDPRRFVVVTSAELDADTNNVDVLTALQDEYAGDLEIEVWGAEKLSRLLRDIPNLVYAVFGPRWAKAFCGFDPAPSVSSMPKALGFVEDPVSVLNFDALKADAEAAEAASDLLTAGRLFGVLAEGLRDGNFPGHAVTMRWRQAKALQTGGEQDAAFAIFFGLALDQVRAGWSAEVRPLLHELGQLAASLGGLRQAEYRVLECVAGWYGSGSQLAVTVPGLRELEAAQTPAAALLTCLVLEQALVDGMYDWIPAQPLLGDVDADTEALLAELREAAARADNPDPILRARLRCAVADASVTLDAASDAVEAAYGQVADDATAGRLLHGRGLVTARAARAFAMCGDGRRAETLLRQSILASSEDGYFGDTRGAIRASELITSDRGVFRFFGPNGDLSYLPNRRRLLSGAFDPALTALEAAHAGKLPSAFGDARRFLWESRLSGHWLDEVAALTLFGDVLAAAGHPGEAVEVYVHAGADDKAVAIAAALGSRVDVRRWASSRVRRRRAAAVQVIGVQASAVPDAEVLSVVEALLETATDVWNVPWISPHPEGDALEAIARFGTRIPPDAVDGILAVVDSARHTSTRLSGVVANLLVQTFWAVESRRQDVADALSDLLRLADPPYNVWGLVERIPAAARDPLLPAISALAERGHEQAVEVLAAWRIPTSAVQRRARQACAALLRRPIAVERTTWSLGSHESATVELLLALAEAHDLVDVPAADLSPDRALPAGGVAATMSIVALASTSMPNPQSPPPQAASPLPSHAATDPDSAALTAAGQPEDLLIAVARHLVALVADVKDAAASRAQTVHALRRLVRHLPSDVASELVPTLIAVHRDPGFSEADRMEIASNSPLSTMTFDTGARNLPALALLTAAELFAVSCRSEGSVSEEHREFARETIASAVQQLHDSDQQARIIGAMTIAAVATTAPEFVAHTSGLLYHGDEQVRGIGAAHAALDKHMIAALAADPSAVVRAALASRGSELPEDVRKALKEDRHIAVRHNLARSPVAGTSEPAATGEETESGEA